MNRKQVRAATDRGLKKQKEKKRVEFYKSLFKRTQIQKEETK